jgi:hypothetical protein
MSLGTGNDPSVRWLNQLHAIKRGADFVRVSFGHQPVAGKLL